MKILLLILAALIGFSAGLEEAEMPGKEEQAGGENANVQRELVGATTNFKLNLPKENEVYSAAKGVSFHGEIFEGAIGNIEVVLADSGGKVLEKFLFDQSFFDDGVFWEWSSFAMRVRLNQMPETNQGIFRVIDHLSGETIEVNIQFSE